MTTISGDDFNRRATTERQAPSEPRRYTENELVARGYVCRAQYDYTAVDETTLYAVRRYEHPNIPNHKEIRQGREEGDWLEPDARPARVPYQWPKLHAADPTQPVYWCEGEKDVETCMRHGLVATTAAGQVLTPIIVKALRGFHVVVLVDNDSKGEENAENAVEAFRHYAASVRVIRLPRLGRGEDITDWLDLRDGTIEELKRIVEATPPVRAQETLDENAAAFTPQATATLAQREWLYKPAYIRANVSVTAGAGARGKSTLIVAEALAMASGKPLLGITPSAPLRVWYVNLEDDTNELKRKFNAAMASRELTPADIADRLYVESGVGREIVVAIEDFKRRAVLNHALLDKIRRIIRKRRIDVVIFDPFVSLHRVSENDNGAIDLLVKALAGIAQEANCAMMLVHHTRKPKGEEGGVDDARGASALVNAARYVRVLNPMTTDESTRLAIADEKRGFYFRAVDGKTNLTPPAESSEWYRLEGFELGNGRGFEDEGDNVGVVTRFVVTATPEQDRIAHLTQMDFAAAFAVGGPWRFDKQARAGWAGDHLALWLGMVDVTPADKGALDRAIRNAVVRGWLTKFSAVGPQRKPCDWVKLADVAPPAQGGAQVEGDATC